MNVPALTDAGIDYRLVGVSALEAFFDFDHGPVVTIETDADVVQLARVFDGLTFPGLSDWDALVPLGRHELLVRTADAESSADPILGFSFDPRRHVFRDPNGLYPLLKTARTRLGKRRSKRRPDPGDVQPVEIGSLAPVPAALVAAATPLNPGVSGDEWRPADREVPAAFHRMVLTRVVTGRFAWRGLEILSNCGYLDEVIPELGGMAATEHSKEGHPEGDVWAHTLETFRYRKTPALALSLALLFHDSGKPHAPENGGRRFDGHADLGSSIAAAALRRLEFDPELAREVQWLCRFHMIPGALDRLPDYRRDPLMRSPLFPVLLELYRCDLSSTFRGPDGYYRACTEYRRFLKRRRGEAGLPSRQLLNQLVD